MIVFPAVCSWKSRASSGILHGRRPFRPITRFSAQATIRFIIFGIAPVHEARRARFQAPGPPLDSCHAIRPPHDGTMKIGVPKEIKIGETRVSMTPSLCRRCVSLGAKVIIQKSAGASLVSSAESVWKAADLVLKVKEPLPSEYDLLRQGQVLFTYLHLAAGPGLAKMLLRKRILGIAYETVEGSDGSYPLLKPMSQIAGRLAIQIGAYFLQSQHGGSGVLLGGIPGTLPGHVVVVGAGNSGAHAVQMAAGMGARVTVLDVDTRKLEQLDTEYRGRVVTLVSNPINVETSVAAADLLVGAVLVPAAKAPTVVTNPMKSKMRPGGVIVDIAIDQG